MTYPTPLRTLFSRADGESVDLPPELFELYGTLALPAPAIGTHVIANFVTTLDGVTSLGGAEPGGGGEISGFDRHDQMVMGILRAVSDAVVVGAGTLRSVPRHVWTAEHIFPEMSVAYSTLRRSLGRRKPPLNVIVTARGDVDHGLPVFGSPEVDTLVITTEEGREALARAGAPPWLRVVATRPHGDLTASAVLDAVRAVGGIERVLVEGGPHLMGSFLAEGVLDELFLTLSPQVAGREAGLFRPGLVEGVLLAPERPRWATLRDARLGGSHLFLRYGFTGSARTRG